MKKANIAEGNYNPFKGGTTYKDSFHWKKGIDEWTNKFKYDCLEFYVYRLNIKRQQ